MSFIWNFGFEITYIFGKKIHKILLTSNYFPSLVVKKCSESPLFLLYLVYPNVHLFKIYIIEMNMNVCMHVQVTLSLIKSWKLWINKTLNSTEVNYKCIFVQTFIAVIRMKAFPLNSVLFFSLDTFWTSFLFSCNIVVL